MSININFRESMFLKLAVNVLTFCCMMLKYLHNFILAEFSGSDDLCYSF